jgi:hypothetical protein
MSNGHIVAEGTPRSLLDDPSLAHIYLGAPRTAQAPREGRR